MARFVGSSETSRVLSIANNGVDNSVQVVSEARVPEMGSGSLEQGVGQEG